MKKSLKVLSLILTLLVAINLNIAYAKPKAVAKPKAKPKIVVKATTPAKTTTITQVIQNGTIKGTVTWQYNDYVGTKPDINAKIYLFSKSLKQLNLSDLDFGNLSAIGVIPTSLKGKVFYAEANGNGYYQINSVPKGEYLIYIVSQKTTRDISDDNETNYIKGVMSQFIPDTYMDNFLLLTKATMNKFYSDTIEIISNDSIDVSHDFGNTAF